MTLIEALVAIAIICGVMGAAIETFRFGASRLVAYETEAEAVVEAESLLARGGEDLPLQWEKTEERDGRVLTWSLTSREVAAADKLRLIEVESHVRIVRGELTVERVLSSLKLLRVTQK
jgi:hypothetical protein